MPENPVLVKLERLIGATITGVGTTESDLPWQPFYHLELMVDGEVYLLYLTKDFGINRPGAFELLHVKPENEMEG